MYSEIYVVPQTLFRYEAIWEDYFEKRLGWGLCCLYDRATKMNIDLVIVLIK